MVLSLFNNIKAILFDFGGTLDSDGGHWLDRFYDIYVKEGLAVPFEKLKDAFYWADEICCNKPEVNSFGLKSLIDYHVKLQFDRLGLKQSISSVANPFYKSMLYYLKRNFNLLKKLRSFYKLCIVSNFYGNLPVICEDIGISRFVDVILDSERIGLRKPDTRIFKKALDLIEEVPEKAVFVGDSYERDMIPCKSIGMKVVWLKGTRPRVPKDAPRVDLEITNLMQLYSFL